jgi:hypothetical protein
MDNKSIEVRIICYYNFILSSIFIFGSIVLFLLPRFASIEIDQRTYFALIVFMILSIFYIFSANQYLKHKKRGRVLLLISCITQVTLSIKNLITTYLVINNFPAINIVMLIVGLWGLLYLNTKRAKNWIEYKRD